MVDPGERADDALGRDRFAQAPRIGRRLPDRLLTAFHLACDQAEYDVAAQLLQMIETLLFRSTEAADSSRRRNIDQLVAAHTRLWLLRHPETDQV